MEVSIRALENQAQAFYQAGKLREALRACQRILSIQPQRADVLSFAGEIALASGANAEAARLYQAAVAVRPDFVEARNNLGLALKRLGRLDEAISVYQRVVEDRPDLAAVHHNLADAFEARAEYEKALTAYRRSVAIESDDGDTWAKLGFILQRLGRLGEAAEAYRRALALQPDRIEAFGGLITVLTQSGHAKAVLQSCDDWLNRHPGGTEALAFKSVALNELGDQTTLSALLDFDRLVRARRFAPPPGYANLAEFNDALSQHVCGHPTLKVPPKDDPTYHLPSLRITHELLCEPKGPMAQLEVMMNEAVKDYLESSTADPTHPFLANLPQRWRLASWAAVLDFEGNLLPHIHLDGYLSGVYYVQVPEEIETAGQAGWFELGRPPSELRCKAKPVTRTIQPEEGLMLLFPAYFYHQTVPFRSTQRRISIAFDVMAKD